MILLIPIGILGLLRESRADRAANVEREIGSKWGGVMHVESPLLIASLEIAKQTKDGKTELEKMPFFIVPEDLQAECTLTPEIRHRGIYQAVLYKGTLHLKGSFRLPKEQWEKRGKILLDDLRLACAFSNAKAVKIQSAKLQDQELLPRRGDSFWRYSKDFYLPAKEELSLHHGDTVTFDITMELKGTRRFLFEPIAKNNEIVIKSSWPHPCFIGSALPDQRDLSENGFEANWSFENQDADAAPTYSLVSHDTDFLHSLNRINLEGGTIPGNTIGVELMLPVDKYLQVERVQKYSFLVVAIILIAFLIGERLTGIWVHPLQYLFIGASLVTFYLLLLALSEHLLFGASYLLSVLVTAGMVTAYSRAIFARKCFSALILGGIMLLAYGLVYLVIGLEDFALLFGTFVVLLLLGILMAFTRKLNADAKE